MSRQTEAADARIEAAAARSAMPNPLVLLWRWRYEIGLIVGVPAAASFAFQLGYGVWPLITVANLAFIASIWRPARVAVQKLLWVVITQHRIRRGFLEAYVVDRRGRFPIVLLTRSKPYGEQVLIWLRAGMTIDDLEASKGTLAAACWAAEVRIAPHRPNIVILEVIRRPRHWTESQPPQGASTGEQKARQELRFSSSQEGALLQMGKDKHAAEASLKLAAGLRTLFQRLGSPPGNPSAADTTAHGDGGTNQ